MFQSLSEKLELTFKKLRGRGKITETDVSEAMRDVRMALLEADVNFKVVKEFVAKIKERAIGQEVLSSLTPVQHIIKIVNDELTELMGVAQSRITMASKPPTVIMMVGLQGSGKTTTCAKLASVLTKQGKKPMLVAADIYRPAAIKQLQVVGEQVGVPVFEMGDNANPVTIVSGALKYAYQHACDVMIIDTAGRLHIDESLMQELSNLKQVTKPHEILLVVDAMTGQDAVNVAETFNSRLGIDGVILTKLDGDARGGAALSIKAITGKPIKYIGIGEKLDGIEPFYPDRMAQRILGMGDMLSLIEKAESVFDEKKSAELEKKLRKQEFTLDDFLDQLQQIKKMGSLSQIMGMIPGMGKQMAQLKDAQIDKKQMSRVEAIIYSMTPKERAKPEILNARRKQRVAKGSGSQVQDVNRLLKQFDDARKMMKTVMKMSGKKGGGGMAGLGNMFGR
ncbi:MAG: signal recognition particle protein [Negativicutes bacterium]|jgi:signal recognition particle subunit SRP54